MSHFLPATDACSRCGKPSVLCGHLEVRTEDAKLLKRVAAEMFERAREAASAWGADPWRDGDLGYNDAHGMTYDVKDAQGAHVASTGCEELAAHIAGMTPAVALALADWLSMTADHAVGRGNGCSSCIDQALTVARAYLGSKA